MPLFTRLYLLASLAVSPKCTTMHLLFHLLNEKVFLVALKFQLQCYSRQSRSHTVRRSLYWTPLTWQGLLDFQLLLQRVLCLRLLQAPRTSASLQWLLTRELSHWCLRSWVSELKAKRQYLGRPARLGCHLRSRGRRRTASRHQNRWCPINLRDLIFQ